MDRHPDRELLAEQLGQALAEVQHGQGDPFEVAVLAGLLARYTPAHEAVAQAAQLRDSGRIVLPDDEQVDAAVDRLHELDSEDSAEERYHALSGLDELCAGAWFCGQPAVVADAAEQAARMIAAFPKDWQDMAELASAVMEQTPPHPADPARRVWRALEGTQWQTEEDATSAPRCESAQRRLGLLRRVALSELPERLLLQAAGGLPPPPEVHPLCSGPGFDLALTVDATEGRGLVLRCPADTKVRLLREGQDVPLVPLRPGLYRAPARPGVYQVVIDGDEAFGEVTE